MTLSQSPPSPPTHYFHKDKSEAYDEVAAQRKTSARWLSGTNNSLFRALGRRSTTTTATAMTIPATATTNSLPRHSLQSTTTPLNNIQEDNKGRWEKVIFSEQPGSRVIRSNINNTCQEISSLEKEIYITKPATRPGT